MMVGLELRPVTEINLCPSEVAARIGTPQTHFGRRALERGVKSIPGDVLGYAVSEAVRQNRQDMVDRLWPTHTGNMVYRFRVSEGLFYALMSISHAPVTLYTHKMVKDMRQARRVCKRAGRHGNKPRLYERERV